MICFAYRAHRSTGKLNEDNLNIFHNLVSVKPGYNSDSFRLNRGNVFTDLRLGNLIAIGGNSCVYDLNVLQKDAFDRPVVLKCIRRDAEMARIEQQNNQLIAALNISPVCYGRVERYLVFEKCSPVISTMNSQTDVKTLTREHFLQLLNCLIRLHAAGYGHRDVRLPNILINSKDQAVFSDFEFMTKLSIPVTFAGSRETASQRNIYNYYLRDRAPLALNSTFLKEDDMESLYKTFLIYNDPILAKSLNRAVTMEAMWDIWSAYLGRVFHRPLPLSHDEWVQFLTDLFTRKYLTLEEHHAEVQRKEEVAE